MPVHLSSAEEFPEKACSPLQTSVVNCFMMEQSTGGVGCEVIKFTV